MAFDPTTGLLTGTVVEPEPGLSEEESPFAAFAPQQQQPQRGSLFRSLLEGALLGVAGGLASETFGGAALGGVRAVEGQRQRRLQQAEAERQAGIQERQLGLQERGVELAERAEVRAGAMDTAQIAAIRQSIATSQGQLALFNLELEQFPQRVKDEKAQADRGFIESLQRSGGRVIGVAPQAEVDTVINQARQEGRIGPTDTVFPNLVSGFDKDGQALVSVVSMPAGMALTEDVKLPNGRVLPKGTPIADRVEFEFGVAGLQAQFEQVRRIREDPAESRKIGANLALRILQDEDNFNPQVGAVDLAKVRVEFDAVVRQLGLSGEAFIAGTQLISQAGGLVELTGRPRFATVQAPPSVATAEAINAAITRLRNDPNPQRQALAAAIKRTPQGAFIEFSQPITDQTAGAIQSILAGVGIQATVQAGQTRVMLLIQEPEPAKP